MAPAVGSRRPFQGALHPIVVPSLLICVWALSTGAHAVMGGPMAPNLSRRALAPLSPAREGAAAASNGDLLVVAGGESADGLLARVDVLDRASGRWRTLTTDVVARRDLGAAIVDDTLILVGGRNAIGAAPEVERVDLRTGRVTLGRALPTPRAYAGVAAHQGTVYVAGGTLGWGRMSVVEIYDVARDRWHRGPELAEARDATLVATDSALYALGGFKKKGEVSSRVEKLTPAGWLTVGEMPAPTSAFAAASVGDAILTFGDWADPGRVLRYDLTTRRWTWLRGDFSPRRRPCAAFVGGHVVVAGGSLRGAPLTTTEAFAVVEPGAS